MRSSVRTMVKSSLFALVITCAAGCGGDDGDAGGALVAPTNLKAELVPGPALHVTWTDTPNEHHFRLERKVGTGAFKAIEPPITFNIVQYHDADVTSGTYTYRIAGGGKDGAIGPFSAEVTAVVP